MLTKLDPASHWLVGQLAGIHWRHLHGEPAAPLAGGAGMKANLSALAAGLLFGMGLLLSGMSNPGEVLSFLDGSGVWSPDLIGVLGSVVLVSLIGFQLARRKAKPRFEAEFPALRKKPIDRPRVLGSLVFGIGWGLAGYCPSPALAGLALGNDEVLVILVAMLGGGLLQHALARRRNHP